MPSPPTSPSTSTNPALAATAPIPSPIPRPSTPPPQSTHPLANPHSHPVPSPGPSPLAKRPKPTTTTIPSSSNTTTAPRMPDSTPATTSLSTSPPLLIKKLVPTASTPTRGSAFAAGYDLYAAVPTTIPARGKGMVSTGLAIAVPAGTYGRVAPRSGLASKHFIDVGAGVIDADYRGEVKVLLFNHAETNFVVKEGERVAQLVLERIYTPEVAVVEELKESVRGAGGFGSTG